MTRLQFNRDNEVLKANVMNSVLRQCSEAYMEYELYMTLPHYERSPTPR